MADFYMMEAANLFCGSHDPASSKHLALAELKLPDLSEIFADHSPGGGVAQIELSVGVNKLESSFKLNAYDPELLKQFGLSRKMRHTYTAYGVVLNKRTGERFESKAVIEARLGSISSDAFQRGELQGHEYALNEIMFYELSFNGGTQIKFDFFNNVWDVGGGDENSETNSILRIG